MSVNEDFDLKAFGIDAIEEQTRAKRLVRVGAIQNKIVLPTTAPITKQVFKNNNYSFLNFVYLILIFFSWKLFIKESEFWLKQLV